MMMAGAMPPAAGTSSPGRASRLRRSSSSSTVPIRIEPVARNRMPQRDRTAIDVDACTRVELEVADELFSNHRESFVDLEQIDITDIEAA